MSPVPEYNPTKLGTKKYWDDYYDGELKNFSEIGDEGEIWFGLETSQKMVHWALENVPPASAPNILEVGTGNGVLLLGLIDAGYDGSNLYGIDYSDGAIKLARSVAARRAGSNISFSRCNFLLDDPPRPVGSSGCSPANWDLILDKGTYDAIGLADKDVNGHSPAIHYPERVSRLLPPGGFFLITSCNYTEDELKESFISEKTGLVYHSRIQHPVYTYAGKTGTICSSVAFKKL